MAPVTRTSHGGDGKAGDGTTRPARTHQWDPDRYLSYADERGRPFVELLARVAADAPGRVVDLGCGPGNLTRLLAERWPQAHVLGLDSSPQMVEQARRVEGVDAQVADIVEWSRGGG